MSGKRYPEEFKIEAVRQVIDRNYSISDVARRWFFGVGFVVPSASR